MAGSPWGVPNITHEKVLDENPNLHLKNAENAIKERNIQEALRHIGYAEQTANGRKEILEQCSKVKRLLARIRAQAQEWYRLGLCHENGEGVPQNYEKAVEWYHKAAEQGNADAQFHLGDCYRKGKGVRRNKQQAAEWYRKAAEQGNADARDRLDKYDRRRRLDMALLFFQICLSSSFYAVLGIAGKWVLAASLNILLGIRGLIKEGEEKPTSFKHRIVYPFIFVVIMFAIVVISLQLNNILSDYLWEKLLMLNGKLPEYLLRVTSLYEKISDFFRGFVSLNDIIPDYLFRTNQVNSLSCCIGLVIAIFCEFKALMYFNFFVSDLKKEVHLWETKVLRNIFTKLLICIRWGGMFILVGLSFIGGLLIQNIDLRNLQINFPGGFLF